MTVSKGPTVLIKIANGVAWMLHEELSVCLSVVYGGCLVLEDVVNNWVAACLGNAGQINRGAGSNISKGYT